MKKVILLFGAAGVLFSGYLSGVKLFTKACAFNEGCPRFLGYSACYFGFAMFLTITIFAILLNWGKMKAQSALNAILSVSLLGVAFSGYFSLNELPQLMKNGLGFYKFGLPTCMLGFIFFVLVFILSYVARFSKEQEPAQQTPAV